MTELSQAILASERAAGDASRGLPEEVFLLVSRLTPLVNVDLLIKDESRRTLLTWRDDGTYSAGWHVPGGIVRFKEKIQERLAAVAELELGAKVSFRTEPLAIHEIMAHARTVRGHFISFLYECALLGPPDEALRYGQGDPRPGQWAWHEKCPDNLISVHEIYRRFF
jgi:ADP-ribose pyrophosphatase YjhB (NUDIX family)